MFQCFSPDYFYSSLFLPPSALYPLRPRPPPRVFVPPPGPFLIPPFLGSHYVLFSGFSLPSVTLSVCQISRPIFQSIAIPLRAVHYTSLLIYHCQVKGIAREPLAHTLCMRICPQNHKTKSCNQLHRRSTHAQNSGFAIWPGDDSEAPGADVHSCYVR